MSDNVRNTGTSGDLASTGVSRRAILQFAGFVGVTTALGGALGWGAILGWSARHGPVLAVATRMSAALDLPPWGFAAASLIFPALLAAAAADLFMTHRR